MVEKRDMASSIFWLAVGAFFCLGALRHKIFTSGVPREGLFPLLGGVALISLSFLNMLSALLQKRENGRSKSQRRFFPENESGKKILLTLVALFSYASVLGPLGFFLTTFLFMIFLLKFIEPQRWITTLAASILTAAISSVLFGVVLKIRLPKGVLGI